MLSKRKTSLFEKILFAIGVLAVIMGYVFIYGLISKEGVSWNAIQTIFLWLIFVLIVVLVSVNENMKEELRNISLNQMKELKLLRDDLKRKR